MLLQEAITIRKGANLVGRETSSSAFSCWYDLVLFNHRSIGDVQMVRRVFLHSNAVCLDRYRLCALISQSQQSEFRSFNQQMITQHGHHGQALLPLLSLFVCSALMTFTISPLFSLNIPSVGTTVWEYSSDCLPVDLPASSVDPDRIAC